jgi:hypothetical protein
VCRRGAVNGKAGDRQIDEADVQHGIADFVMRPRKFPEQAKLAAIVDGDGLLRKNRSAGPKIPA